VFAKEKSKLETVNKRDFVEAILRSFKKNRSHFEMGLTKVFFKGAQEEFLEELMRKGGANWVVPPALVKEIKRHLLRKRIQRVCAFMRVRLQCFINVSSLFRPCFMNAPMS
jgi:myosin heavy subunit